LVNKDCYNSYKSKELLFCCLSKQSKVSMSPMGPLGGADFRFVRHQLTLLDHRYGSSALRGASAAFAGTHFAYPRTDDQDELTWMVGYIYNEMVYAPTGGYPCMY